MGQEGMTPEVAKKFKYWQTRTIIASMIGYALFYFVRKNLSIAMPAMQEDLGITKGDLGLFLTLHGLLYGVSKFANGFIGDRVNARYFMVTGLVLSAVCNILFGFSSLDSSYATCNQNVHMVFFTFYWCRLGGDSMRIYC